MNPEKDPLAKQGQPARPSKLPAQIGFGLIVVPWVIHVVQILTASYRSHDWSLNLGLQAIFTLGPLGGIAAMLTIFRATRLFGLGVLIGCGFVALCVMGACGIWA